MVEKYFVVKSGRVALYNLTDDSVERYDTSIGAVYRLEALESEIDIFLSAQEADLEEMLIVEAYDIVKESPQFSERASRIIWKANERARDSIESIYPLYKQNNINELQGYEQADKDLMWQHINSQRDWSNLVEQRVGEAKTIKDLETIEMEVQNG
jgi:uncharacterized protein YwgA